MSVATFIPQVWEAKLMKKNRKEAISELITTKPSKVEGNKIIFNRTGAVAVKNYDGSVSWDEVATTPIEMNFDQKKYFAIQVDDVDAVQAAGDLLDAHTEEAGAEIKETVDTYVLGFYTGADADNVIGTDAAPKSLDKMNVYDYIVDLGTKLSTKKVSKANRFVIINAEVLGLLSKDDRFTRNPSVLENGVVEGQRINGMQVVVSEEIPNADGKLKVIALHKSAIGHATQFEKTEAMRLQGAFADGVRGLVVYGTQVLRPEAMAVLTGTVANQ
ncbi:hypothetical protein [Bacillus infantis]|uniref:phage major capsid protein n=1 Tax=Bacillus infantis TaxID=324767 RepID=UPI003CF348DF